MADARVQGYAAALFQVAKAEGQLDSVADELFRFARTLENEPRLRDALTDPALPPEHRANMVTELLGNRASPHTVNLVAFVVSSGRARDLAHIVDELVRLAAEEAHRVVAEVRSAVPLDGDQRERLRDALQKASGKEVDLKVIVDPGVIGGFVARVGDLVFDATVRRKLAGAQELFGRR